MNFMESENRKANAIYSIFTRRQTTRYFLQFGEQVTFLFDFYPWHWQQGWIRTTLRVRFVLRYWACFFMSHAGHAAQRCWTRSLFCLLFVYLLTGQAVASSLLQGPSENYSTCRAEHRQFSEFQVSVLQTFLARTPGFQLPDGADLLGFCRSPIHLR